MLLYGITIAILIALLVIAGIYIIAYRITINGLLKYIAEYDISPPTKESLEPHIDSAARDFYKKL